MTHESRCLVFGITPNLAFALGSFLVGYMRHHGDWLGAVHVFHNGLSDKDIENFRNIYADITFQYIDETEIYNKFSDFSEDRSVFNKTISKYSALYFAKFEMLNLLEKYEKCIWFDVDMVVLESFPEIWDFDEVAWRPVTKRTAEKHRDIRERYASLLDAHPIPRPNAGVVCVSRALRDNHGINASSIYEIFAEIVFNHRIVSGDEMSLLILAAKYKLTFKELEYKYNCPAASGRASDRPCVVHSIGKAKFWNDGAVSAAFPYWREYYLEWLAMGGSEYNGETDEDYVPLAPHRIVNNARVSKRRRCAMGVVKDLIPELICPDPFHEAETARVYLTGLPTWIILYVGLVSAEAEYKEIKHVALRLEVSMPKNMDSLPVIEALNSPILQSIGFRALHPSSDTVFELVNERLPVKSIKSVLLKLKFFANIIAMHAGNS